MQLNLSELFTSIGKEKEYCVPLEMTKVRIFGNLYPVLEKDEVKLHIRHVKDRKVELTGTARVMLQIPCGRCLQPVSREFLMELDRDMDMSMTTEERLEALDEQPYIDGYNLDVEELVYGELVVNMPMKVLCKPDCKGICNRCGANLNHETCHCDVTELDPRMSAIRDIFNNFKEV